MHDIELLSFLYLSKNIHTRSLWQDCIGLYYSKIMTLNQKMEKEVRKHFGLLSRWLKMLCRLNGVATDTTSICLKQLLCDIPNQRDWLELKALLTFDWQFNDMGGEQQLIETGQ